MCGFVGCVGEHNEFDIDKLTALIKHRGPDSVASFCSDTLKVVHARLSIIDLSGGCQPMISKDGRWILVFNGEVFNYKELRRTLESQNIVFQTDRSDTEVLLQMLIRYGEKALHQINGMFSFALFDRQAQSVFCARDRFGIKPFFYTLQNKIFSFASEIKPLLACPWFSCQPNLQALFHYFSLGYTPGNDTAFEGVKRLPPGHWLRFSHGSEEPEICSWWVPNFSGAKTESKAVLVEKLRAGLAKAVDTWSISDVPIGCSLSGGLDSSAIVGLLSGRGKQVKTYSLGLSGYGEASWNELELARIVAQRWGTEHREIILQPRTLLADLVKMVSSLEEPYGGGLPSWAIFKAMKGEIKVAMTGVGGDELFGNYNRFYAMEGGRLARIPCFLHRQATRTNFEKNWFLKYAFASDHEKISRVLTGCFQGAEETLDFMWRQFNVGSTKEVLRDRVVRMDLATQLPNEFLQMTDRFSMAHSIEARTPFLDLELS